MNRSVVGLVGASGFVGSACLSALSSIAEIHPIKAPRFTSTARTAADAYGEIDQAIAQRFGERHLSGIDVLVNAAGLATAASTDLDALVGANALLPLFLLKAAESVGVQRLVHISTAAVQGRGNLDESERMRPESPYAFSKAWGEALIRQDPKVEVIRYRPTSVQGPSRPVTQRLARLARAPYAAVAAPGDDPTPQVPVDSVADAVMHLTDLRNQPPTVVLHPWTGTTTRSFLADLGGREVRLLPRGLGRAAVASAFAAEATRGGSGAQARRLEMLLFGQQQEAGWLDGRLQQPHPDWVRDCGVICARQSEGEAA